MLNGVLMKIVVVQLKGVRDVLIQSIDEKPFATNVIGLCASSVVKFSIMGLVDKIKKVKRFKNILSKIMWQIVLGVDMAPKKLKAAIKWSVLNAVSNGAGCAGRK